MEIGFLANTAAALVQLPLALGGRILRKFGAHLDALALSERICSKARMAAIDRIDQKTKSIFRDLYGWNLFVAAPTRSRTIDKKALVVKLRTIAAQAKSETR
jgi:hypothetical protein